MRNCGELAVLPIFWVKPEARPKPILLSACELGAASVALAPVESFVQLCQT